MTQPPQCSTGLPGLDRVLKGILPGDNIVWQVDEIHEYRALVEPYYRWALQAGKTVVYFRFASHPPLVPPNCGAQIYKLEPADGFERFIADIHAVIEKAGRGAFYVFDCLSELAADWYSDQMLGNFFMLTCPYLYDLETIAYFALFTDFHSSHAIGPISDTTQLLLEVLQHHGRLYIHPVKVQQRYSPTMHMLHAWEGQEFKPVTASPLIADILTSAKHSGLRAADRPGFWGRAFAEAQDVLGTLKAGQRLPEREPFLFQRLLRMVISRDEGILRLAQTYFTIEDLLDIRKRMIGTGLIGGKAVGMLLARAIVRDRGERFAGLLEAHDSFYIGSDVFYTFLVRNGIWWVRQKQRDRSTFLEGAEQARQRILTGNFPPYILQQFGDLLDYFGQSPFIVRSSSLLEDNFGNSFAGKYESVFCANQGPRERRLEDLLAAVRAIYASSMSERALSYRAQRGLLERDEQMALLVMRVSGNMYGRKYYPQAAGVAYSFNPYVWNEHIDPKAGVLRLVFGLGTRAVNRSDDDYTRIVALNDPQRRPETNFDEVCQYAQRRVDYLDLEANQLVSDGFAEVMAANPELPLDLFATADQSRRDPPEKRHRVLTFDNLLARTSFVADMRDMLQALQEAYEYPVDVEFTLNFLDEQRYKINLVQCRPLPVQGGETAAMPRVEVAPEDRIIEAHSAVIGHSRLVPIDRFVYVVPRLYGELPEQDRHRVARLIGAINRSLPAEGLNVMLLGPGRWGTSSPALGIPVAFADINRVAVLCEIVAMRENLVPDVSLGTHFLNELVEVDMLYLALFPLQGSNYLARDFFEDSPNRLEAFTTEAGKLADVVRVVEAPRSGRSSIMLAANALEQSVLCYRLRTGEGAAGAEPGTGGA